jgi:hypothetical protein
MSSGGDERGAHPAFVLYDPDPFVVEFQALEPSLEFGWQRFTGM